MKYRTGLFLGAAFLAGALFRPAAQLAQNQLGLPLGIPAALASPAATSQGTYRLLSLFGQVFERVRADYVVPVKDQTLIDNALNGMLTGLDPHSGYMDTKQYRDMQVQTQGQFGGLGLEVTEQNGLIKVISPIDGTPAAKAGIKPGDFIVAIDKKSVEGMSLNQAVSRMRGAPNSKIMLLIKRPGVKAPIELTLVREVIHVQAVHHKLFGDIGYIRLSGFTEQANPGVRAAIAALKRESHGKIKGFILDLRNNPGGLLDQAVSVANDFLNQGEIVSTRGRHPVDDERWDARPGDLTHGAPLVVMVNAGSASASEIVSGALQDNRRAVVVGVRSFGKGSVQTIIPIPGHGALRLTTARYYTPSGRSIQDLGITPDVVVHEQHNPAASFPPLREGDLTHALHNPNGKGLPPLPPRADLPAIVKTIPAEPPATWPAFDAAKPATDFQLQQALKVANAMVVQHAAAK